MTDVVGREKSGRLKKSSWWWPGVVATSLAGVAVVAGLLLWEHRLVKADDLSRVDAAFFTINGYVSVIFFLFWATDVFLGTWRGL